MKHEFWAEFDLYGTQDKRRAIEAFVGKQPLFSLWENITDEAARQAMLAQLLPTEEECARRTKCKDYVKGKNGLQRWYYAGDLRNPRGVFQTFLYKRIRCMASILGLANHKAAINSPIPDLSIFPTGSWAMQVHFTLRKPYLSKDDVDFYIIDNPVKKEWVFKVPYVASSQWKGALRAAMVRELVEEQLEPEEFAKRRYRLVLLFGDEKGEEPGSIKGLAEYLDRMGGQEAAQHFRKMVREHFGVPDDKPMPHFRGRLHFYPTFFDRIGLEAINPHPRDTGAGKNPLYFECVPAGTSGIFTLLYVPLDAGPKDEATADFKAVARGVRAMLTTYGFGAKTSSGYGVADVLKNQSQIVPPDLEKVFWKAWEEK
ncbi:MAG: CRISPR-associated protein [Deltaproteobacteria bacterium]|nr:MAG: CRISPR-associated protein [Deltaproteobacteria bacterium]